MSSQSISQTVFVKKNRYFDIVAYIWDNKEITEEKKDCADTLKISSSSSSVYKHKNSNYLSCCFGSYIAIDFKSSFADNNNNRLRMRIIQTNKKYLYLHTVNGKNKKQKEASEIL